MSRLTLTELSQQVTENSLSASFHAQMTGKLEKTTKTGKPYLEVTFADAAGHVSFKAWQDHPQFAQLTDLAEGHAVEVTGKFTHSQWGIDASPWSFSLLDEAATDALMAGPPELKAKQDKDFQDITRLVDSLSDPRLKALCEHFLNGFGDRFRRTAAARKNHHARRGGLVEHVAQMMRCADAVAGVYQDLNRDLLLSGVLFHDCGKLWENTFPENGFQQGYNLHGEMLGHIPIGMEVLNKLWREILKSDTAETWKDLAPSSDDVRMHLLHLLAAHHGTHEFGSPTLPKTPEASALHFIDNLDAKHEMMKEAYHSAAELEKGIFQRQFPLPANLVQPLAVFSNKENG